MEDLWKLLFELDEHLREWVQTAGVWSYGLLFLIIFAETGLVVTPFLPGDSLLFAAGALCAPAEGSEAPLNVWMLCLLLTIAAILGDTVNYHFGLYVGPRIFKNPKSLWLNPKHLERTQEFFERYGGKTIIIARFLPIIRTMAPFVAGVGKMNYGRFLLYNVVGGIVWVNSFLLLGYWFGNLEIVKKNFELVVVGIILVSLLPGVFEYLRHRYARPTTASPVEDV